MAEPLREGYPDYQRIVNFDGPTIFSGATRERFVTISTPILPCSRYASVHCAVAPPEGGENIELQIAQFMNVAGTPPIVFQNYFINRSTAEGPQNEFQLHLPLLAPYVQFSLGAVRAGGTWRTEWSFGLDNREARLPHRPQGPLLIPGTTRTVEAGRTFLISPNYFYAGQVGLSFLTTRMANAAIVLSVLGGTPAEYRTARVFQAAVANAWQQVTFGAPIGAWRLALSNSSVENIGFEVAANPESF